MARLQILSGKREGESVEIAEPGVYTIGTARAAKIQLRDKDIAFKHANVILEDGGALWIEDLGSAKGVFVGDTRLPDNAKQQLAHGDRVRLGTTSEQVLLHVTLDAGAAPAPAPPPAPAAAAPPPPEPAPPAPPAPVSTEASVLAAELKEIKARLAQRDREVKELTQALDAAATGTGAESGGGSFYGASAAESLEGTVLELRQQNDALNAQVLERDGEIATLKRDLEQQKRDLDGKLADERKKRSALEREIQRGLEAKESASGERKGLDADLAEIRVANEKLVLENDELKDKVEGLSYRVEQESSRRGELVRERVREVQNECKRLEESNAELRTLVEAYEEKIDELDEKVEELEGEHEELEKLLEESRGEVAKQKSAKEASEKTLKQRVQKLDARAEDLEAEVQRLRAAGTAAGAAAGGAASPELKSRLERYEKLLDGVETLKEADAAVARLRGLEAELEALRARLQGAAPDAVQLEKRAAELEKLAKADAAKIERLEKKNRELVRQNVAAEMARAEAERRTAQTGGTAAK